MLQSHQLMAIMSQHVTIIHFESIFAILKQDYRLLKLGKVHTLDPIIKIEFIQVLYGLLSKHIY